jgi:hypothetical protein
VDNNGQSFAFYDFERARQFLGMAAPDQDEGPTTIQEYAAAYAAVGLEMTFLEGAGLAYRAEA